jgi:phospholipid/cholesterol/gamma-HCH transport system permease protein
MTKQTDKRNRYIKDKHRRVEPFLRHVGDFGCTFGKDCINILSFVGEIFIAFVYAIFHPRKVRWRETFYYMDSCGSDALPIIVIVGFLLGLVLALQGAIQLTQFGAQDLVINLVVLSLIKELGPIMIAVVATGRAGSAFAAEIGTMKVTEEVDAMITMGFSPVRFLVIPKILALLIVLPMLTILGDIAGIIGGMFITYFKLGISIPETFYKAIELITFSDYMQGFVKSLVFALLIAGVGCMRGFEASGDAQSVGRSATSAVVSGIFLIAVANAIITILFAI